MSLIRGALGIALLNLASRNGARETCAIATAYIGKSKLEVLLGPEIWDEMRGKEISELLKSDRFEPLFIGSDNFTTVWRVKPAGKSQQSATQ